MRKTFFFLLTLIFSFIIAAQAQASEVFGKISTNPTQNNPPSQNNPPEIIPTPEVPDTLNQPESALDGNEAEDREQDLNNNEAPEPTVIEFLASTTPADLPKESSAKIILGTKIYSDGTLLRGQDNRIYLIRAGAKKYIANLKELAKYKGQKIIFATDEELSCYDNRGYLDGELIRQRDNVKIYEVVGKAKKHILNLEELRANYAGLEIFNISQEEINLYENWKK